MRYSPFTSAAFVALILAIILSLRIFSQDRGFLNAVNQSLATTEGYDQKFIDLVNHLENEMATRASFAYPGGKDPMTGRRREIAAYSETPVVSKRITSLKTQSKKSDKIVPVPDSTKTPEAPFDRVKLTAIIADDYGQHTAIVMNGERSQSVDVGDMVGERKVLKITSKEITMSNDTGIYTYDISGNRTYAPK
jgi:hypothetical protein